jgi:ATP-binding cassette subfamily F protein 3
MPVLFQINNVSKHYGARVLLDNASASFSSEQKIGLIGRNGAGKSTLCKIIIGQEEKDSGTITRNADLRLSYLEQHDPYKLDETIADFLMRYTGKEEWECGEVAAKFQLKYDMLHAPIKSLAGGYRTRVKLAAMLLRDPNFLILDEPTNYLDLSTLILLEHFLQDFNGGFIIVSHDREFLKRTCEHTLEVENGKVTSYPGDIEAYFEFKEQQRANVLAYNKGVEKKKEQLQEFVDRFKARASTATRAKSKMKQIEKLKTIEVEHTLASVNIRIPEVERKGGVAFSCDSMTIGYPDKDVAAGISLEVERGHHVAVLGDNGQGKTTFLRTIAGDLQAKGGGFKWGTGLKVAYYAQHVFATLNPKSDVYGHLVSMAAPGITNQEILDLAGCFLFKGDDVQKKVSVLSGGERARLVLAGMLLTRSHVLLLDEPTNHLDFETVEALAAALKTFAGTIFFISHDRTFVNLIANHILEVKDGRILKYPGKYEDYVYYLEQQADDEFAPYRQGKPKKTASSFRNSEKSGEETESEEGGSEKTVADPQDAKKRARVEIQELTKKIQKTENRMKHNKAEKDKLQEEMAQNPFFNSKERGKRLKELNSLVEEDEAAWLELQEKMEKLKQV